jgi:hypothetical protein
MQLEAWWREMRPRCCQYGDAMPLAPEVLGPLAPEVRAYFALLGERSWFGHRVALDLLLLCPGAIQDLLSGDDYAAAARGWLPFACQGDRTGWYLSPASGCVARTYDDSPWYAGPCQHDVRSFAQWRAQVAALRLYDRGTATLIALIEEERVALAAALADPDPRAVLIFARDLQYRVTPDDAWSFRPGAPERMARVDGWSPPPITRPVELFREDDTAVTLLAAKDLVNSDRAGALAATAAGLDGMLLLVEDIAPEPEPVDIEQARRDAWARWRDDD